MSWLKSCVAGIARLLTPSEERSETGSPLPRVPHVSLPLSSLRNRLLIVSDVHGCFDEVLKLLEKVEYSPETMTVFFVGDLVAKGPKSLEVIRFLMKQKCMLAVRGNHEDNVLRTREDAKYGNRGVYSFVKDMTDEEMEFVKDLPLSISVPELQLLVVHAGLDPNKRGAPVHAHRFSDLIRIRSVNPDGTTTKHHPDETRKLWGPMYVGPPFVVYGHDAKRKLQMHPWARGLDTGCCYGGSLTGLLINDTRDTHNWMKHSEIVSVAAAKSYADILDD